MAGWVQVQGMEEEVRHAARRIFEALGLFILGAVACLIAFSFVGFAFAMLGWLD